MITQKQQYRFPGSSTATEVYYTLGSNNSCVSVTPASGTVTPGTTVEFTFTFESESCFSTVFTLQTWDDVCATPVSTEFSIANPCSTLSGTISNTPSTSNPFIFTAMPSGGTAPYTVEWEYNSGLFTEIADTTSSGSDRKITFQPTFITNNSGTILPGDTTIKARITDYNGCEHVVNYTYSFCQPVVQNYNVVSHCIEAQEIGNITARNFGVATIQPSVCAGTTTDWTSIELDYDTNILHATLGRTTATTAVLEVYGIRPTTAQSATVSYSVANSYGIRSNLGTVTIRLNVCPLSGAGTISGPVITTSNTTLLAADGPGTVKTLAVEDIIAVN